jgi:hypothetical protein
LIGGFMKSIGKILSVVTAATLLGSMPVMASNGSQPVTKLLKDDPNAGISTATGILQEDLKNENFIGNYSESEFIKDFHIKDEKKSELPVNWYLHPYDLDASFYKPWSGMAKRAGTSYRGATKAHTNKGYTFTTDINPDVFIEQGALNAAATIEVITAKAKRLITQDMKSLPEDKKLEIVMDIIKRDMSYDYTLNVATQQCHLQKINEGLGVCTDMSLLALYLCDEIGLQEPGVVGVQLDAPHTFNFVNVNGVRTYFDPTAVVTANDKKTFTDPIEYVKYGWGKVGFGTIYPIKIYDFTISTITGSKN